MTLEQATKDLEEVEATANLQFEDFPARTRGAWGTAVAEAKGRLKDVYTAYKTKLMERGVAIFLRGNPTKVTELGKLILEEGEGLVVDANALYTRLTTAVELTFSFRREWGVAQTHRLHLALQEVMYDVGLTELSMPNTSEVVVNTPEDTQAYIKKTVRAACGDNLNKLYLINDVAKSARLIRYTGTTVPVVIQNADSDEAYDLSKAFGKGSSTVTLTEEDVIDKEFLTKTFKEVTKDIRKKK